MSWPLFFLLPVGAALATWLAVPPLTRMLSGGPGVCSNYRGLSRPSLGGLALLWGGSIALAPLILFRPSLASYALLAAWWGAALAGLADDLLEKGGSKGLKGHLGKLAQGELTAGAWKALSILGLSVLAAAAWSSPWAILLQALVGALSANALNLLDLRPGRAVKGYLLGSLFLVLAGGFSNASLYLLLLAAAALAYLPWELREEIMLGDTGANLLGINLGLAAGRILAAPEMLLILLALLLLHWYAERASLSRLIEKNRLLALLDRLGRRTGGEGGGKVEGN